IEGATVVRAFARGDQSLPAIGHLLPPDSESELSVLAYLSKPNRQTVGECLWHHDPSAVARRACRLRANFAIARKPAATRPDGNRRGKGNAVTSRHCRDSDWG